MGVRFDRDRDMQTSDDMIGLLLEKGPSGSQAIAVATLLSYRARRADSAVPALQPCIGAGGAASGAGRGGVPVVGAFGLAGLSSLGYLLKRLRGAREKAQERLDQAKRRVREASRQFGQKTREAGNAMQVQGREEAATST